MKGIWYPVELTVDSLKGEAATTLKEWLQPMAEATGAAILVTDDAEAFKEVADEMELAHPVCKNHAQRNTERLVEKLQGLTRNNADRSLRAIGVSPEQAVADLEHVKPSVQQR